MFGSRVIRMARVFAKLGALCILLLPASTCVLASPVGVSYVVSGSAGDWTLDFSVTNKVNSGQVVYIFGVLLPDQGIVNGPTGWNNRVTIATGSIWNPDIDGGLGGPNINYNNLGPLLRRSR